jgi:excisionase family DNA binding protein
MDADDEYELNAMMDDPSRSKNLPEKLLTLEQVAEYLSVDKFTIYRLLAEKGLPAFKVGNQWRFKRRLLENWLQKNSNARKKDS